MNYIEKQIAEEIAKENGLTVTKLGLRFDKVAIRLLAKLGDAVERAVPNGEAVIVTVTAPIKLPAKTDYVLEKQIKDFLEAGIRHRDRKLSIFENKVCLRLVGSSSKGAAKFVGLVHNPDTDVKMLLDLATQWLLKG